MILYLFTTVALAAPLDTAFYKAAVQHSVPHKLLRAICWVESRHRDPGLHIDGGSLSHGICQVKLATAHFLDKLNGRAKVSVKDLRKHHVNIMYAAEYIAYQLKRYGNLEKAITAYNRGSFKQGTRLYNRYVIEVKLAMKEGR